MSVYGFKIVGRHIDMPVVVGATKPPAKSTPISYSGLLYGAIDCATLLRSTTVGG